MLLLSSLVFAFHIRGIKSNEEQVEGLDRIQTFVESWDDGHSSFDWAEYSSSMTREETTHRLPLIISNLFDNRLHKLVFSDRYQAPRKLEITLWDGFRLPQSTKELNGLINSWEKLQVPVEFNAGQTELSNELIKFFNLVNGSKIQRLELCFDEDYFEDPNNRKLWKSNVPLHADFKDLEELSISLAYGFSAANQLKPFSKLKRLNNLKIENFDEQAARHLLDSQFPNGAMIEIGYSENGLAAVLLKELETRFNLDEESRNMLERNTID